MNKLVRRSGSLSVSIMVSNFPIFAELDFETDMKLCSLEKISDTFLTLEYFCKMNRFLWEIADLSLTRSFLFSIGQRNEIFKFAVSNFSIYLSVREIGYRPQSISIWRADDKLLFSILSFHWEKVKGFYVVYEVKLHYSNGNSISGFQLDQLTRRFKFTSVCDFFYIYKLYYVVVNGNRMVYRNF